MRMALLAIVLLLPLSAAAATPLGIQLGSTIEDLRTQGLTLHPQRSAYEYVLEFPGKQHEGTAYVLLTPELGVCEMRWVSKIAQSHPLSVVMRDRFGQQRTCRNESGAGQVEVSPRPEV